LLKLGAVLKKSFRGSDIACRYGGEEFTLILPEASLPDALHRMEELRQEIKKLSIEHQGKMVNRLSASFGLVVYPQHGSTVEQLLKTADEALYRAKRLGRDRIVVASK
jgi:diguanylate cyclase (GGDEF)-like protein